MHFYLSIFYFRNLHPDIFTYIGYNTNFSFDSHIILLACFLRFYLAMVHFVRMAIFINDISSFSWESFLIIDHHINDHLLLTMQPSVASSVFWLSRYQWVLPTLTDAFIWHYQIHFARPHSSKNFPNITAKQ